MFEKIIIGIFVVAVVFLALKVRRKKVVNTVPEGTNNTPDYAKPKEPDA